MRWTQALIPTLKETPAEAEIISHKLLLRAGLIRQTSAGIYAWLPLGFRVLKNIERIVREEQDRSGAQEVLMPTIQSASERQRAASARGCICALVRSAPKPSRMACGVMDCNHSRCTGLPKGLAPPAYCSIKRKINSPSRPASQALTSALTSLRLACLTTAFNRVLVLSTGFKSKKGGTMAVAIGRNRGWD